MPTRIPLEVHAITVVVVEEGTETYTVQVGRETRTQRRRVSTRREVPPRQDRAGFDQALAYANAEVLAHELAHLFDLPHVPRDSPRAHWNLMYEAYRAGDELTPEQVARARASRVARHFGN